ncbi:stalk domain-containing protein [Bacillus sp. FJAT-26390]|uniref:stalk domain-containing protein n=1 Tax=Bacillus sp. FJAT-26390 TaxID=1743142 RepID=UPI000807C67A|nr:copper amine oxidase N-terminal domain-containing protein [Bacillus sp. FJAT-26390]OBZ11216.1 hypothetical protein A7975_19880 [Bacillus sp. FJAT-26390]
MKRSIALLLVLLSMLSLGNNNFVYGAKVQILQAIPLTQVIDIDDRSYSEYFYALQEDGTIWIGSDHAPAIRGPQIKGAVKISGNLVLTAKGDVWTWSTNPADHPKRVPELSGIQDISAGPAFMALDNKDRVYVWGNVCYVSLMRPDLQDRQGPSCVNPSQASQADVDLANIPKVALEKVKAIRSSLQSLMVLMSDGKTVQWYGNTYIMDMGMHKVVSQAPVTDFTGFDTDVVGGGEVKMLPDKELVSALPNAQFNKLSVSYESFYSLYLKQDGTVWSKSDWVDGSLQQIQPLKNIAQAHAIALNSGTALDNNGIVWTWGNRSNMPYAGIPDKILSKVDAKPALRQLSLKINGKYIPSDPGPIQMNGVTFVPLRVLFESIGAKVNYVNDKIAVTYINQVLQIKVYDTNAVWNGENIKMNAAVTSYQGKTYVPVRFISEALGANVQWDAKDGCVVVQFAASNAH